MKKNDISETYFSQSEFFLKVIMVMKITIFFLLIAISSTFAKSSYSQNTRFSLRMENVTIQQVFDEIQKKSEFIIFYKDDQVDLNHRSNVDVENATVDQILDLALNGTDLGYKIIDRQIVILKDKMKELTSLIETETNAQQPQKKYLSGTVKDTRGLSLPGVTVIVKGTTIGSITDNDGKFKLSVSTDTKTLIFSFVGMKSQECSVNGRQQIDIVLEEETVGIDEVIAIGYGTVKKSDLTGAVSSVKTGELQQTPMTSIDQGLIGRASGVQVTQTSGMPGAVASIRVRGS